MPVVITEDVKEWPKNASVPISSPFDVNLVGRVITFWGVRASDKTDRTDLSGAVVGQIKDATYTPGLDMLSLANDKLHRLVAYTDDDGNGNRIQVCPNPLTPDPYYFIPQDPDGV